MPGPTARAPRRANDVVLVDIGAIRQVPARNQRGDWQRKPFGLGAGGPRHDGPVADRWFAVRCIFRLQGLGDLEGSDAKVYEERITIWRATSPDDAIAQAESEAAHYAEVLPPIRYLGLAQSYEMVDPPEHGAEMFSLIRDSDLPDGEYLDAFFDTGTERQRRQG